MKILMNGGIELSKDEAEALVGLLEKVDHEELEDAGKVMTQEEHDVAANLYRLVRC